MSDGIFGFQPVIITADINANTLNEHGKTGLMSSDQRGIEF
jgi:hypothetical protein